MSKTPIAWRMDMAFSKLTINFEPEAETVLPHDGSLQPFIDWFENEPDARERFRWALRDSLDELLDGQRTGRWCYQHLTKTEKTYLGTAVEVNLTKEFGIANGTHLDWSLAGSDIDCKFSKDLGGWEIPMEMYLCADHGNRQGKANHPALLTWMDDDTSRWAAGLVTVTDERLKWKTDRGTGERVRAYNRDNKRRLADAAQLDIYWLWGGIQDDLPRNLILQLQDDVRARILQSRSGQQRVNQLFREVQNQMVGRQTVLTVAQQDDAPKRARDARLHLRSEGILVLGHQESHPAVAHALGLPVPAKGEWIATRVTPVVHRDRRPSFILNGQWWARARQTDPAHEAPLLPRQTLGTQDPDLATYKAMIVELGYASAEAVFGPDHEVGSDDSSEGTL